MSEEKKNNTELDDDTQEEEEVEEAGTETDTGDKGSDGKSGKETGKSGKPAGKTFTQEQVNRMMTREKNQGRNAVYKELGIDPRDSKMVAMVKALIDSQKTDEQKDAEKRAEDQRKTDEAEKRAMVAEAKAEAMMLGAKSQYVEDIVTLSLAKMTDDSDLKTIIGEFKIKYPVWFGESEEDDKDKGSKGKVGQKGTGSSIKKSDETKGDDKGNKGLGARLAAQRKSSNGKKSSYWGNNN